MPCACPTSRTSSSAETCSRSATVCTPTRRSRSAVAGPTPGITPTFIGRSRSRSVPGGTTTRPSGLSRSLAILATSLEVATPTEPQRPPVTSRTSSLSCSATAVTPATLTVVQAGRGEVDERLVERERLDQGRELAQQRHHRDAAGPVGVEPAGEERRVRAAGARLGGGHRRAHPEGAGLVGRGGDDAAAADPAHHDRLAAQRRLVALLDGREEGVQVDVQDRRVGAHVLIMPATRRPFRCGPDPVPRCRGAGRRPQPPERARSRGVDPDEARAMTETKTLRIKNPGDLLAAVPGFLGFHPRDSVVLLTTGAADQPVPRPRRHARRPRGGRRVSSRTWSRCRAGPAPTRSRSWSTATTPRWRTSSWSRSGDRPRRGRGGGAHRRPRRRRALVLPGRLRRRLRGRGHAVRRRPPTRSPSRPSSRAASCTTAARRCATPWWAPTSTRSRRSPTRWRSRSPGCRRPPGTRSGRRTRAACAPTWSRRAAGSSTGSVGSSQDRQRLDTHDVGRLLVAMVRIDVRDVAWSEITRADARVHVDLWRDVVRRSPLAALPAPAALLAFAAWLVRRRGPGLVCRRPRPRRPTPATAWRRWSPRPWPARCRRRRGSR